MWSSDPRARLNLGTDARHDPGIRWEGYLRNGSGYGEEARGYALELARRGYDVGATTFGDDPGFLRTLPREDAALLARMCERESRPDDLVVEHLVGTFVERRAHGGYHVARTMFETDSVPAAWLGRLSQVDEIWVPTPFNVTTFRAAGVRTPLHVVPAGVDPDRYRPDVDPLPLPRTAGTVFLGVAANGWESRHGWDVLLRAWSAAFGPHDDVLLVLKVSPTPGQREAFLRTTALWIDRVLTALGRARTDCAPILVLGDNIPSADVPRLYAAVDAVVSPLRGTAFGRPTLEAMSCALPVIGTRWSAIPDFLHDDNGLLIEVEGLDLIGDDEPVDVYRGHRWARPGWESLAQHLRTVVADPSAVAALARKARADVVAGWTWGHAADLVEERIADIRSRTRRRPAATGATRLRWEGDQYAHHSLAVVNREVASRLVHDPALDVELLSREVDPDPDLVAAAPADQVRSTGSVLDAPPHVTVRHQWPPDWTPPEEGAWVAVQAWEFGAVPRSWMAPLAGVDEVWCYTEWVRRCYEASGFPAARLHLLPLGVDGALFTPEGARYPLRTRKTTRLLFCGGAIHRKGIDVLLRAYCAAFGPEDDVCLVVKAHGTRTSYEGMTLIDTLHEIAASVDAPEVEVIDADLGAEELAALYRSCDALVHPYRGEGFALPVAEAMASGIPAVVTAGGATDDFCDDDDAYLLPARLVALDDVGQGPSSAQYFWAEPDAEALVELLRRVVADPEERRVKGARSRERILDGFTWDLTAGVVAERVAALAGTIPVRERPQVELATRTDQTVLHAPDWVHLDRDEVIGAFLARFTAEDDVCLVLPVDPTPEAVGLAVTGLEALLAGLEADEVPELLLVPWDVATSGDLRALVRWSTDRMDPDDLATLLGVAPSAV